jgi:hypothetical protein
MPIVVFYYTKKKQTQKLSLKGCVSSLLFKRFIRLINDIYPLVAVKLDGQDGNIIKL